jgi:hypothetical protein
VRDVRTPGTAAQRTVVWRIRLWPDGRLLDVRHVVADSATRASADTGAVRRIALGALTRAGINTSTLQESEARETARPARRDVMVTYTDTAVKLPDAAAARVWVQIAGDEPLSVRRGVELPETFLRAERARRTNRMIVGGVAILLLLGFVVTGAMIVKSRRVILVNDGTLDRRATYILIGAIILLSALSNLNYLPEQLFSYDTAEPWGSFITSTAVGFLMTIPLSLFVFGLWLALGAMRRRVGIPMLAGAPSRQTGQDMLIAGLGLGGIIFTILQLGTLVTRGGMPNTPTTVLNDAWPLLGAIAALPTSTMITVALVGIPLLVVAGLTPSWRLRALYATALLALIGAVAWSFAPAGDPDPLPLTLVVASVAVLTVALAFWATLSAWSWIVAALAFQALGGLRQAVYGAVWQEQGSGALTVLVACAIITFNFLRAARRGHGATTPPGGV